VFILKKLITALILPPTSFLFVTMLGLLLALTRRYRRIGWTLAVVSTLGLIALSTPFVAGQLIRLAGDAAVLPEAELREAEVIVIPSAGVRRAAVEYGKDVAGSMSMDRVRYGAYLARKSGLPILVTGGTVYGGMAEAELMRDVLEHDFGLDVRWVENRSRNTHENAVFTAQMLRKAGFSRIVLVTHAVDTRRFRREFEGAGLQTAIAATSIPGRGPVDHWVQHMPSAVALQGSAMAIYELVAYLALLLGLNSA